MFLVEHQDRARHLAGLHRAKRLVDVLEAATARDHLVELELPLTIQFDVARHVDLEAVRAHGAALDLLLAQERRAVELDLLADRDHADDRRGAARTQTLEHLLGRLLEADRLERVVYAGAREFADRLDGIRRGGVHGVRGAELLCGLELVGDDVHRDDHPRTGDHRALDRREPDAAGAVHGHRRTRLDTRGVEDGADAGGHAAADQSRAIERHVVPHLHQPALVDQHLLGVGREIGELVDRRALPRQLRRFVGRPDGPALAEVRAPGQAVLAVAAEDREARDDVVTGLELRHVRADRFDDPRRLVPEDGGRRERVEAFDEVEIAVADAARHRAHQHFARDGLGDVDVLDRELFVRTVEDGSFHVALLWRVWTGVYRRPAPLRRGKPHNRRTRGNSSAPARASVTSAAPLVPSATPTPNNDASAPIWRWPSGPSPIATTQAPPARPRRWAGTLSCIRLWANKSASAPAALATIRMTMTPRKPTSAGAKPRTTRLAPKATSTARKSTPPPPVALRIVTAMSPRIPPTERAAFIAPSPSGPTPSTSRARLGKSAWCAKPRISAPAVSSMSAGSTGSFRIAVTKSTMLCQRDPAAGGVVPIGADADSRAAEPAR